MPKGFRTLVPPAVFLVCGVLGHATTLTTSGSSGSAAYLAWEGLLTGTPTDVSVPAGSGSYNTSSGFSISAGPVTFTVVGVDPEQVGGYYLSLSGNTLTDGADAGSQLNINLNAGKTGLLFQVQNSPDPTKTLGLTLSNGAALAIPGSVTYFGVVSSTPIVWADIVSYNGEVALRDISFGNANPADFPQTTDEGGTAGLVATGIGILTRALHARLARFRTDAQHVADDLS